jgi:hypothetical protein
MHGTEKLLFFSYIRKHAATKTEMSVWQHNLALVIAELSASPGACVFAELPSLSTKPPVPDGSSRRPVASSPEVVTALSVVVEVPGAFVAASWVGLATMGGVDATTGDGGLGPMGGLWPGTVGNGAPLPGTGVTIT